MRARRVVVVGVVWALLVSLVVLVPARSALARTGAQVGELGDGLLSLFGERSSVSGDGPVGVLSFQFASGAGVVAAGGGVRGGIDPDQWCVLFPDECGGPPAALVPTATATPVPRDRHVDARASAADGLERLREELQEPSWRVWPAASRQVVNLDSFLHIEKGSEPVSATGRSVGGQQVTVYGVPRGSVWEFTESAGGDQTVVHCRETEPWTAGDGSPLCAKEWEHSSSVTGTVSLRVGVEVEFSWNHTYASGVVVEQVWSSQQGELVVNEVLARGVSDEYVYEPPGAVSPEVYEPDEGIECGGGAKLAGWLLPGLSCEPVQLIYDLFTGFLVNCIGAVIGRVGALWDTVTAATDDPVGFVKEKVAGLKQIYDLLLDDPVALFVELGRDLLEIPEGENPLDWNAGQWADWAGGFICSQAFDYLTGNVSNRLLKHLDGRIRPNGRNGPDGPNNRPDNDADHNDPDRDSDGDNDSDSDPDDPDSQACRRSSSFPAGTNVVMGDGNRQGIETIRPGQRVMSYDVDTSVWEPKLVLDQWSHRDRGPPGTVTLVDGSTVIATVDHRFWTPTTEQWVELGDLRAGVNDLLTPTGPVPIQEIAVGPAQPWTVWELTVADNHNFAVWTGTSDVLVHNNGCDGADGSDALIDNGDGTVTYIDRAGNEHRGPRNDDGSFTVRNDDFGDLTISADGLTMRRGDNGPLLTTGPPPRIVKDLGPPIKSQKPRTPSDSNKNFDHSKTELLDDGSTSMVLNDGTSVLYDPEGFIVLDSTVDAQVPTGSASNTTDFRNANQYVKDNLDASGITDDKLLKFFEQDPLPGRAPDGYTWHHHQDTGRMQLVDKSTHSDAPHTGGASIWGKSEPRYVCDPGQCSE